MKRINFKALIVATKLTLGLTCLIFAVFTLKTSAQQRTTRCTMNGKVYDNCTPLGNGRCEVNGQTFAICETAQPRVKCAEGGLLIIKLNSAGNYYERSGTYTEMNDHLKCRGLNVGFFGAASDVTWAFHVDENLWSSGGAYKEMTMNFFAVTSSTLGQVNTAAFKDLSETGKLLGLDGRYLTNPVEIDKELVKVEQLIVEKALEQTGIHRIGIVSDINTRIKRILDRPLDISLLSPTMRAIAQVRKNRRVVFRNAEYDYGGIYDRMAVGEMLAERHRK